MDQKTESSATVGPVIAALGHGSSDAEFARADLVRAASALARESGASLECLTIDTGRPSSAEEGESMARTLRFARGLGAVVSSAPDIDAASGSSSTRRRRAPPRSSSAGAGGDCSAGASPIALRPCVRPSRSWRYGRPAPR